MAFSDDELGDLLPNLKNRQLDSLFSQRGVPLADNFYMARQTLTEKTERCVRLLLGLRHREVQEALLKHGFTHEVMHKGWRLAAELGMARTLLTPVTPAKPTTRQPLLELEELQDAWFLVTRATLKTQYPSIAAAFFSGLTRQRGALVALSTATFFARLRDLAEGAAPYGADGPRARELLLQRGLTPAVEEQAQEALGLWHSIEEGQADDQEPLAAEEAALSQLWAFYLEWSGIAQATLTNASHLRWLGLASTESRPRRVVKTRIVQAQIFPQRLLPRTDN